MPRGSAQISLPFAPARRRKKRPGRPNLSGNPAHSRRPRLDARHPLHVTLRLAEGLPSLRRKETFRCLREAVRVARRQGLAIAHFAVLSNHVHLILEAPEPSVTRALRSLGVSFARRLNRLTSRKGGVFHGRYHLRVLATPTEVRRALVYVLTNAAKRRGSQVVTLDPFSSVSAFVHWRELLGRNARFRTTAWCQDITVGWLAEMLTPARTWLLKEGWRRGTA